MDNEIIELKLIYEKLNEKLPFVALVTSSFPQEKVKKPVYHYIPSIKRVLIYLFIKKANQRTSKRAQRLASL